MSDDDDDGDWGDESGPFCVHWVERGDHECVCGHPCSSHRDDECTGDECACVEFKEAP